MESSTNYDLESAFPTLTKAPIREAIIDFRVELPPEVDLGMLSSFPEQADFDLTKRTERRALEAKIEFNRDREPRVTAPVQAPDGYIYSAPASNLAVQVRLDGFTLSRFHPYHDGDTFEQQARTFWKRYVEVAKPVKITRIAIRNINAIDVPPGEDLQSFVLTGPEIARALPQVMVNFFMRVVLPDVSGAVATITQTFDQVEPDAKSLALIFDVDAYRVGDFKPDDETVWEALNQLRAFKNRIFFNSLTTKALERYR